MRNLQVFDMQPLGEEFVQSTFEGIHSHCHFERVATGN